MCDFRGYPALKDVNNNSIDAPYLECHAVGHRINNVPHYTEVEEEGIYHITATGSFYAYFDGYKWFNGYEEEWKYDKYCDGSNPYRGIVNEVKFEWPKEESNSVQILSDIWFLNIPPFSDVAPKCSG